MTDPLDSNSSDTAYFQKITRREKALAEALSLLTEAHGPAAKSHAVAHNTVCDELGVFEEGYHLRRDQEKTIQDIIPMIIRGRSDALEANLNSAHTANSIKEINRKLNFIIIYNTAIFVLLIFIYSKYIWI